MKVNEKFFYLKYKYENMSVNSIDIVPVRITNTKIIVEDGQLTDSYVYFKGKGVAVGDWAHEKNLYKTREEAEKKREEQLLKWIQNAERDIMRNISANESLKKNIELYKKELKK